MYVYRDGSDSDDNDDIVKTSHFNVYMEKNILFFKQV